MNWMRRRKVWENRKRIEVENKLRDEEMKIAVAGTGYVGLSIATLLAQHNDVVAVDVVPEKIEKINRKESPIEDKEIKEFFETKNLNLKATLDYKELEGFPTSTVLGHKGQFVFGYVGNVKVVIMQGRVHYYEGYTIEDVVLPTRLMRLMGAKILFLTNASGGINSDFSAGDFMLIKDHI